VLCAPDRSSPEAASQILRRDEANPGQQRHFADVDQNKCPVLTIFPAQHGRRNAGGKKQNNPYPPLPEPAEATCEKDAEQQPGSDWKQLVHRVLPPIVVCGTKPGFLRRHFADNLTLGAFFDHGNTGTDPLTNRT
jgi:hypothetical protein